MTCAGSHCVSVVVDRSRFPKLFRFVEWRIDVQIEITAWLEDGTLRIEVRHNGTGGADPDGHGLVGMRDRVTTLGGRRKIESPAGGGTLVAATLPLSAGYREPLPQAPQRTA